MLVSFFVVKTDDGRMVNVGQLFVKRDGKTVPASQVITDANADWSDYKGRFYYAIADDLTKKYLLEDKEEKNEDS